MQILIKSIMSMGATKADIARRLDVSWNTVNRWSKDAEGISYATIEALLKFETELKKGENMPRPKNYLSTSAVTDIQRLIDAGVSKSEIARELKVSWNTVNNWHRGKALASPRWITALQDIYGAAILKNLDAKQKIEIPVDNDPFAD